MSWEVALKVEGRLLGAILAALISQDMRRRLEIYVWMMILISELRQKFVRQASVTTGMTLK